MSSSTNFYGKHHLETLRSQCFSTFLFYYHHPLPPQITSYTFFPNHPHNKILILQLYHICLHTVYRAMLNAKKSKIFCFPQDQCPLVALLPPLKMYDLDWAEGCLLNGTSRVIRLKVQKPQTHSQATGFKNNPIYKPECNQSEFPFPQSKQQLPSAPPQARLSGSRPCPSPLSLGPLPLPTDPTSSSHSIHMNLRSNNGNDGNEMNNGWWCSRNHHNLLQGQKQSWPLAGTETHSISQIPSPIPWGHAPSSYLGTLAK